MNTDNDQMLIEDEQNQRAFQEAYEVAIGERPEPAEEEPRTSETPVVDEPSVDSSEMEGNQNIVYNDNDPYDSEESRTDYSTEEQESLPESPRAKESKPRNDYKSMYLSERARANLLNSRINELSEQYRALKDSVQNMQPVQKQEEPVEAFSVDKLPNNVREVIEDYPGVLDAVQYLVNQQLGAAQKKFQSEIDSRVQPIQQQMVQSEMQRARAMVASVHPDAEEVINSIDFGNWVQSLPVLMRNSAIMVLQNGTAQDYIQMLGEYKQARGFSNANNTRKSPSRNVQVPASQSAPQSRPQRSVNSAGTNEPVIDEDSLVRKLQAALTVPSNREPISFDQKKATPTAEEAFNSVVKEFERNRSKQRR